jgi:hypothetical protein
VGLMPVNWKGNYEGRPVIIDVQTDASSEK